MPPKRCSRLLLLASPVPHPAAVCPLSSWTAHSSHVTVIHPHTHRFLSLLRCSVSAERADGPGFRSSDGSISRGACTNLTGLANGQRYKFSVVGHSDAKGDGPAGSVTATVGAATAGANGWTCQGVDGCHPGRPGG